MRAIYLLISTAKAFLCLLARAEPEYLEHVWPKLLPHRLSFDNRSSISTRAAQNQKTDVSVTHNSDSQAGASICAPSPPLLPSYMSSASISPSPPASTPSPIPEYEPIWREGSPKSLYARRMQRLDHLHPEVQNHIASIIWLGDHFLQEDVGKFLRLFCRRWSQTDLGYRPVPKDVAGEDSRIQSLSKRYYHAETFRRRSDIDRLKFRFLRILLYHDFEELCINIQNNLERYRPLSRGQDAATIATDKFIEGLALAMITAVSIVAMLPVRPFKVC
ncbi:hypothetical protein J3E71DRAFT_363606 [Bipolaris maydis]|nr:hypothetical protein J3E71DRAFT_363606 [Bipolaris maydis]